MKKRILKVNKWLQFSRPDEEEFFRHIQILEQDGIMLNETSIQTIAKNYNLPPVTFKDGQMIFNYGKKEI